MFFRIVTGVSLAKVDGVIQLLIAQHTLKPYGNVGFVGIDEAWKPAQKLNISDNHTRAGIDYHTLTYENRSINLDTIFVPDGHVVTGVRFSRNDAGHLRLEVRATEIDLVAGVLKNLDQSVWLSNAGGGKFRFNVDNMDLPTKSTKASTPMFKENAYVRFSPSHRKIDVSQRTVPFIDTLRVEPIIHVRISSNDSNKLEVIRNCLYLNFRYHYQPSDLFTKVRMDMVASLHHKSFFTNSSPSQHIRQTFIVTIVHDLLMHVIYSFFSK